MRNSSKYYVGSNDGKSISFYKEESTFNGITISVKFSYVLVIFFIIIAIQIGHSIYAAIHSSSNPIETNECTAISSESANPIDANGFVFPNSSKELLTEENINSLKFNKTYSFQKLIRLAINEIYCRNGYSFKAGEENDLYYQKYEWYKNTDKRIVKWEDFNEIEKANLRLLISIEKENGYR